MTHVGLTIFLLITVARSNGPSTPPVVVSHADATLKAIQYCSERGGILAGPVDMAEDITGQKSVVVICVEGADTEYYAPMPASDRREIGSDTRS